MEEITKLGGKTFVSTGREVLIKVVIQAIPTFAMGCFKIPLGLCHDIEALIKKIWGVTKGGKEEDPPIEMGRIDKIQTRRWYGV